MSGLKKNLRTLPFEEKKKLVQEGDQDFSLREQCEFLDLNRSSLYYVPAVVSVEDLRVMNRMDEIFTEHPFYGSRRLMISLQLEGFAIGRDHVRTLMKRLGLEAIYPKKNLSQRNFAHKIYPYLLKGLEITRPFQVWSTDITYIRLANGFMYLVAVIDWYSRYVLSWSLSNTLDLGFCVEALAAALVKGKPEIFNTDQGSQFTSVEFTEVLLKAGIKISMDSKGRALDNVFVERLWRSVKYENIYIYSYLSALELKQGLREYFEFYNERRPHQSLGYKTPGIIHRELKKKK